MQLYTVGSTMYSLWYKSEEKSVFFFYIGIVLLKLKCFRIRFIFFYCHSDITSEMHYISVNV